MIFNISKLIKLYDERAPDEGRGSDVSAITAALGEDLLFGLFLHYWQQIEHGSAKILSYSCTGGAVRGPRLDGWLLCKKANRSFLYQTEIKNWAAYSWGETPLPLHASASEQVEYGRAQWEYYFGGDDIPHEGVAKVLRPMRKPPEFGHLPAIPLCCFWFYITKDGKKPFEEHRFPNGKVVHVFSASAYLRTLTSECVNIDTPRFERRMKLLQSIQEF